jgi:hypothetical protein
MDASCDVYFLVYILTHKMESALEKSSVKEVLVHYCVQ